MSNKDASIVANKIVRNLEDLVDEAGVRPLDLRWISEVILYSWSFTETFDPILKTPEVLIDTSAVRSKPETGFEGLEELLAGAYRLKDITMNPYQFCIIWADGSEMTTKLVLDSNGEIATSQLYKVGQYTPILELKNQSGLEKNNQKWADIWSQLQRVDWKKRDMPNIPL